ncbi:MAG: hypothetical protein CL760_13745 [Chloroflexi bacterium]|nr:hypothetical protein [Chloroflexota bacterium]MQG05689.1 tetratricopeptide repeat protein [SAR202 cluster bacterium]
MVIMKFCAYSYRSSVLCFLLLFTFFLACQTNQDNLTLSSSFEDHILKGNSYTDAGDYQNATLEYTKAIDENPNNALAYFSRGAVYHIKEKYEEAISDYTKAIEIDPSLIVAYHNRSNAYKQVGLLDKAEADITKVQELNKLLEDAKKRSDGPK